MIEFKNKPDKLQPVIASDNRLTETFDSYAEDYDLSFNNNFIGRYQRQRVHELLAEQLTPSQFILDVGCGPGSDFAFYQKMNLSVEAIDVSKRMVQIARQRASALIYNIDIHQSSLERFDTDRRYDVIILNFGVINAMDYFDKSMLKLKRLLHADGRLIIIAMPPVHIFFILEAMLKLRLKQTWQRMVQKYAVLPNGLKVHYFTKQDFKKHFCIEKAENLGAFMPTPHQYQKRPFIRRYSQWAMHLEQTIKTMLPTAIGGDHVYYALRPVRHNE
ncbi:MAG: methyltransferase domain-containing protein [Caldithrix sp.]|nr:methyltransferase domain-containing protein [Caldithrix sp.]